MPSKQSLADLYRLLEPTLGSEQSIVVVGANWGDEGKGKIIDLVMGFFDVVARFSGGANAGHTVMTDDGVKVVTHLIPTGLAQGKVSVLGRGEFFHLELFIEELKTITQVLGGQAGKLAPVYIDQMAPLWTPWHGLLEIWFESVLGGNRIGTTNKAIGPLAALPKFRISPVVGDLFIDRADFVAALTLVYESFLPIFEMMRKKKLFDGEIPGVEAVADQLLGMAAEIKDKVIDTSYFLSQQLAAGKKILFEGAQAAGLDSTWGTYPYVSSGNSVAAGAALGTGIPARQIGAPLMVAKTLPTRVGGGPFPSEMWERVAAQNFSKEHPELFVSGDAKKEFLAARLEKISQGKASHAELSQYFQVLGDERGATTGRGRSVGFIDIPWLQYASRINGPKWVALTRFDMLSSLPSIPIVTGYKFRGEMLAAGQLPVARQMDEIEPVLEEWTCWPENIYGCTSWEDLPQGAKDFLNKLEEKIGVPILLVGTGPERSAVVVKNFK